MIEIVMEFVVKEECQGKFKLAYGPAGAWSSLFGCCTGYRGTTVLRDTQNPRRYLTIDLWNSQSQWEHALAEHKIEYADIDTTFTEWTESKTEVGIFSVLAEATVRPRGKTRRR